MKLSDLKQHIQNKAGELGFIKTGFSRTGPSQYTEFFNTWLNKGYNGDMKWMEKNRDVRTNSSRLFDNAVSIISFAYPYRHTPFPVTGGYTAARYTEPDKPDYHIRIREKLHSIADTMREKEPPARTRVFTDTPPLFEREAAQNGGVGFIGKNTNLIIPGYGSYAYLGEIVTEIELPCDDPFPTEQCGDCTRCVDACPTGALEDPYTLNANKCVSYLTVEYNGNFTSEQKQDISSLIGCDACQQACPFNKQPALEKPSTDVHPLPSPEEFINMDKQTFEQRFSNTSLSRPGWEKIKRNAHALVDD